MNAIPFPESNRVFTKPPSMTDEECVSLHVHDTGAALVSCWQLTDEERAAIAAGAPLWLWVIGRGHPPISLQVETPFETPGGPVASAPPPRGEPSSDRKRLPPVVEEAYREHLIARDEMLLSEKWTPEMVERSLRAARLFEASILSALSAASATEAALRAEVERLTRQRREGTENAIREVDARDDKIATLTRNWDEASSAATRLLDERGSLAKRLESVLREYHDQMARAEAAESREAALRNALNALAADEEKRAVGFSLVYQRSTIPQASEAAGPLMTMHAEFARKLRALSVLPAETELTAAPQETAPRRESLSPVVIAARLNELEAALNQPDLGMRGRLRDVYAAVDRQRVGEVEPVEKLAIVAAGIIGHLTGGSTVRITKAELRAATLAVLRHDESDGTTTIAPGDETVAEYFAREDPPPPRSSETPARHDDGKHSRQFNEIREAVDAAPSAPTPGGEA